MFIIFLARFGINQRLVVELMSTKKLKTYKPTIGVDFALKVINWDPHTLIRLQLWDIAGQERFGTMTRVYYRKHSGA